MKRLLGITCLSSVTCFAAGVSPVSAGDSPLRLFVPDGQVKSHPLRVFVTKAVQEADLPRLDLYAPHTIDGAQLGGVHGWKPKLVAPGQQWTDVVDGQAVARDGTLLMFDLSTYPMPGWKPMARVTPVLRWGEAPGTCVVVGSQDIYLGHLQVAVAWTAAMLVVLTAAIGLAARRKTGHMRYLLCGPDHYFSLWRVQLTAWTLAVGGMVFCFGMIRMAVPHIPDSLVALMGLSLATGAVSAAKARTDADRKTLVPADGAAAGAGMNPGLPAFADLISDYSEPLSRVVLSIPKAQMLFWTVVILVLFITKTILDGQLWEVPWELVALTGFSQAGYVGDKFTKGQPVTSVSPAPPGGGGGAAASGGVARG